MGCKNCKKKKVGGSSDLTDKKEEILRRVWDDSMGKLKNDERFIIFIFAWFPIIVGYITIVKFLISIF